MKRIRTAFWSMVSRIAWALVSYSERRDVDRDGPS